MVFDVLFVCSFFAGGLGGRGRGGWLERGKKVLHDFSLSGQGPAADRHTGVHLKASPGTDTLCCTEVSLFPSLLHSAPFQVFSP